MGMSLQVEIRPEKNSEENVAIFVVPEMSVSQSVNQSARQSIS